MLSAVHRFRIQQVQVAGQILPVYAKTAIAEVLRYQNIRGPRPVSVTMPRLLVVSCMDCPVVLDLPTGFGWQVKSTLCGGAVTDEDIQTAQVAGIRAVAVIAAMECGMPNPKLGLALKCQCDPAQTAVAQARDLRRRFEGMLVAPLLFSQAGARLHQIVE